MDKSNLDKNAIFPKGKELSAIFSEYFSGKV